MKWGNDGPRGCGLLVLLPLLLLMLLWRVDPPPDDAPGDDCPEHGGYAADQCDKCIEDEDSDE